MKTLLKNARVWRRDASFATDLSVLIEDGKILDVSSGEMDSLADEVRDLGGAYLCPGLVDVHTHGRAGFDFNNASASEMALMRAD